MRGKIPQWVTEAKLIKPTKAGSIILPNCLHNCELIPFEDEDGRLVVECPNDPPCFEGYLEIPKEEATFISLDKDALLLAIIRTNALKQVGNGRYKVLGLDFLGIKELRESRLFVYLATGTPTATHFHAVNSTVKTRDEHFAVILTPTEEDKFTKATASGFGVILHSLPDVEQWNFSFNWLDLADAADPSYVSNRRSNGDFVYEDVTVELATDPGKRHLVKISGYACRGFAKSDARFARFLYLAACRKADSDIYFGGWVEREDLILDAKSKQLGHLRESLRKTDYCGLSDDDLNDLIKTNPEGDGTIRLAVSPNNIIIDDSLLRVKTVQNIRSSNHKRHTDDLKKSLAEARSLYKKALELLNIS